MSCLSDYKGLVSSVMSLDVLPPHDVVGIGAAGTALDEDRAASLGRVSTVDVELIIHYGSIYIDHRSGRSIGRPVFV